MSNEIDLQRSCGSDDGSEGDEDRGRGEVGGEHAADEVEVDDAAARDAAMEILRFGVGVAVLVVMVVLVGGGIVRRQGLAKAGVILGNPHSEMRVNTQNPVSGV